MHTCSKCSRNFDEEPHYTGMGINTRPRCYCPACWRKVEWARANDRARGIGYPNDRARRANDRARHAAAAALAAERREQRYWERVDNYRELGYDPN